LLQPSRSDPLEYSHDDFQPFPRSCGTYSFEHLELFYEYLQPPLCLDFSENSYKGMIPKDNKNLKVKVSILLFPHLVVSLKIQLEIMFLMLTYLWGKIVFNLWFVARISIIQPHIKAKQAMIWEKNYFLRSKSMSYFSSMFSLDNHGTFLKFLMIPSQTSRSDESEGSHSLKPMSQHYDPSSYHNPIQRSVEEACRNPSQHAIFPPSQLHEFDSIFGYVVVLSRLMIILWSMCFFFGS
jgi:hypothetical protein